jgi:NAD(P)-dependent dehydrogenase (short-subunit alcohol dehydrogenase family)
MAASPSPFDFRGTSALVVGGAGGLGAAMAEALLAHGAKVCIASRSEDKLKERAKDLTKRSGTDCDWIVVDIGDEGSVQKAFASLSTRYEGGLNIVVNSAGINLRSKVEDLRLDEWESVLRANLTGSYLLARSALALLRKPGWGRFVQVSSLFATRTLPMRASYAASKAGTLHLTRTLAMEWAPYGITANSISPGPFETDMARPALSDPAVYQKICERIPVGRFGKPFEIAPACLFLCSRDSGFVTGADILVDGGWSVG